MGKTLSYDLLARDRASDPTAKVGRSLDRTRQSADKLGSAFSRVTAGSRGLNASFGLIAKGATLAAGVGGLALLAKGFKDSYSEAREAQKTTAQTNAVIKSTGGAAKLSADQVGDLATAISNKVGVDDEAIQSGENLLLTFTNVRNAAGKGNDVFNQATRVITDMTAAMNQGTVTTDGLKTANIQVGKALNDPIKGITALTKVGVTFSAAQKKQIEGFVKSGQTIKAQKVILAELNKEFGGSAAAGTTATQKLGVAFKNAEETIGGLFLPVIDKTATWLAEKLPGALNKVLPFLTRVGQGISGLTSLLVQGDFTGAFRKAFHVDEDSGTVAFLLKLRAGIIDLAHWIMGTAVPAIASFMQWIGPKLSQAVQVVSQFITTKFVPAFQRVAEFIGQRVVPAVSRLAQFMAAQLGPALQSIGKFIQERVAPAIAQLAVKLAPAIAFTIRFAAVLLAVQAVIVGKLAPVILAVLGPAFSFLVRALSGVISVLSFLQRTFVGVMKLIANVFLTVVGFIVNGAARAFGWVPGLGGKLKGAAAAFNNFRDQVNTALAGIHDQDVQLNLHVITHRTETVSIGPNGARGVATGGPIYGPGTGTSDTAGLFKLSNNEHVWTAKEVAGAGGHGVVEAMRKAALTGVRGLAAGGPVGTLLPHRRATGGPGAWWGDGDIHVHLHGGTFIGTDRRRFGQDLVDILKDAAKARGQRAPIT